MRSEADFTRPRPDCPYPNWWHAADAYATEAEVTELVAAMVRALQPEFVLETGTHTGTTAEAIGRALAANGHGRLVSLELDPGKASAAAGRLAAAKLPVTVVTGDSRTYVPDQPIDFAWFDSSIEARVPEYERLLPFFSSRAVVMFHDTGPHHDVRRRLVKVESLNLIYLPTPRGVAIGQPRPESFSG